MEEIASTLEALIEPENLSIELRRGANGVYAWTVKVRCVAVEGTIGTVDTDHAMAAIENLDLKLRAKYGEAAQ